MVAICWDEAAAVAMLERAGIWHPGQDYSRDDLEAALQWLCTRMQDAPE